MNAQMNYVAFYKNNWEQLPQPTKIYSSFSSALSSTVIKERRKADQSHTAPYDGQLH